MLNPDWTQLPGPAFQAIYNAVDCPGDVEAARLVCKDWQSGLTFQLRSASVYVTPTPRHLRVLCPARFNTFVGVEQLMLRWCAGLSSYVSAQESFEAVISAASLRRISELTLAPLTRPSSRQPTCFNLGALSQLQLLQRLTATGSWTDSHIKQIATLPCLQQLSLDGVRKLTDIRLLAPLTKLTHLDVRELPRDFAWREQDQQAPRGGDPEPRIRGLLQPLSTLQRLQHLAITEAYASTVMACFGRVALAVLPALATATWASSPSRWATHLSAGELQLDGLRWLRCGSVMRLDLCDGQYVVGPRSAETASSGPVGALAVCLPSQPLEQLHLLHLNLHGRYNGVSARELVLQPLLALVQLRELRLTLNSPDGPDGNKPLLLLLGGVPHLEVLLLLGRGACTSAADCSLAVHTALTRLQLSVFWDGKAMAVAAQTFAGLPFLRHLILERAAGVLQVVPLGALPSCLVSLELQDFTWRSHDSAHLPNLEILWLKQCSPTAGLTSGNRAASERGTCEAFGMLPQLRQLHIIDAPNCLKAADAACCCRDLTSFTIGFEALHVVPRAMWDRLNAPAAGIRGKRPTGDNGPALIKARQLTEPARLAPALAQQVAALVQQLPRLRRFMVTSVPKHATCLEAAIAALAPLHHLRELQMILCDVPLSDDSYRAVSALSQLTLLQLPYTPMLETMQPALRSLTGLRRFDLALDYSPTKATLDRADKARKLLECQLPTTCVNICAADNIFP